VVVATVVGAGRNVVGNGGTVVVAGPEMPPVARSAMVEGGDTESLLRATTEERAAPPHAVARTMSMEATADPARGFNRVTPSCRLSKAALRGVDEHGLVASVDGGEAGPFNGSAARTGDI
jgi:hypothetical protein